MLGPERRKELATLLGRTLCVLPPTTCFSVIGSLSLGPFTPGSQGSWCLSFLQDLRAQKVLRNRGPHPLRLPETKWGHGRAWLPGAGAVLLGPPRCSCGAPACFLHPRRPSHYSDPTPSE